MPRGQNEHLVGDGLSPFSLTALLTKGRCEVSCRSCPGEQGSRISRGRDSRQLPASAQDVPPQELTSSSRLRPQGWRPSSASLVGAGQGSCFSARPSRPPAPTGFWPGCSWACRSARDRLKVFSTSCRSVRVTPWEDNTSQRRPL